MLATVFNLLESRWSASFSMQVSQYLLRMQLSEPMRITISKRVEVLLVKNPFKFEASDEMCAYPLMYDRQ